MKVQNLVVQTSYKNITIKPCTLMKKYKIQLEGGGAEVVIGKLTKEQFKFWDDEEKVEEIFEDFDGALTKYVLYQEGEDEIPEKARFSYGHWASLDDIFHDYKILSNQAFLTIEESINETDSCIKSVYCESLDNFIEVHDSKINTSNNDILELNPNGDHVYHAISYRSGLFFEVGLELEDEIDLSRFEWNYVEVPISDIGDMVKSFGYDGVTYENEISDDETTQDDIDLWIT